MKYPQFSFENEHGEFDKINLFGLEIDADNNYTRDEIIINNGKMQYEITTKNLCEYLRKDAYQ